MNMSCLFFLTPIVSQNGSKKIVCREHGFPVTLRSPSSSSPVGWLVFFRGGGRGGGGVKKPFVKIVH